MMLVNKASKQVRLGYVIVLVNERQGFIPGRLAVEAAGSCGRKPTTSCAEEKALAQGFSAKPPGKETGIKAIPGASGIYDPDGKGGYLHALLPADGQGPFGPALDR